MSEEKTVLVAQYYFSANVAIRDGFAQDFQVTEKPDFPEGLEEFHIKRWLVNVPQHRDVVLQDLVIEVVGEGGVEYTIERRGKIEAGYHVDEILVKKGEAIRIKGRYTGATIFEPEKYGESFRFAFVFSGEMLNEHE